MSDADQLKAYLAERDVPCPRCGYNVRGVGEPVCPECGDRLDIRRVQQVNGSPIPVEFKALWVVVCVAILCGGLYGAWLVYQSTGPRYSIEIAWMLITALLAGGLPLALSLRPRSKRISAFVLGPMPLVIVGLSFVLLVFTLNVLL